VVITSRYDGIIHKVHHTVDDFVKVGSPLVDIFDDNAEEEGTDLYTAICVDTDLYQLSMFYD